MTEAASKVPAKAEQKSAVPTSARPWHPFESLRHEVDRIFDEFDGGSWRTPFRHPFFATAPFARADLAVDVAEKDNEYEITAELPGIDEKDVEIKMSNGGIVIRGEKKEEKEEKKKDYHISERRYGSFERYFSLPAGVDADKISATFKKGVLTVTLPKTAEAQKHEKKISIKSA